MTRSAENQPEVTSPLRSEVVENHVITSIQDEIQLTLSRYIEATYPHQPFRFGKLLLLLPSLKTVNASHIEETYFRPTIGDIPLSRIVADMFTASPSESL